jgi:hypothetical protein
MGTTGVEEGIEVMNQELRQAFDDLKDDMRGAHQETRDRISEFGRTLNKHMLEDALIAEKVKEIAEAKARTQKWVVGLLIGGWGAIITGLVELLIRHFGKGGP